jgi:two-component system NarL family sensor kinase
MQPKENSIDTLIIVVTLVIFFLTGFIILILLKYQKKRLDFKKQLKKTKEEHENILLNTQLEIQEQTLQHVAREIHDNIGLSLTMAKLNLNTINQVDLNQASMEKTNNAISQVSNALEDLSRLSKTLNCDHIVDEGLINALELEIQKIKKLKLYTTQFKITGTPIYLDAQKELIIFRIIQESLHNSIRHAMASILSLDLEYTTTQLLIRIHDNGTGWITKTIKNNPGYSGGSGLKNMQQRSKLINGDCRIDSTPSNGTTVYLTIPI